MRPHLSKLVAGYLCLRNAANGGSVVRGRLSSGAASVLGWSLRVFGIKIKCTSMGELGEKY